jgi:hypothetical protein
VEEKRVGDEISRLKKKHSRIEEVFEGLKWVLAKNPERGVLIPGMNPPRYLIKTAKFNIQGVPSILIVYNFTADDVNIEAIGVV